MPDPSAVADGTYHVVSRLKIQRLKQKDEAAAVTFPTQALT